MQKRLFGILASIAVIVAACGGATTTLGAAGRRRRLRARRHRAACGRRPQRLPTSPTEQILKVDLGSEPPTLDPNKAQDSNSIAVLSRPQPRPGLLRQGPQGRAGAAPSPARGLGRRQDPDLHPEGRHQVQQRRPDRRRRLRVQHEAPGRPADRRAVLLRHGRSGRRRATCSPSRAQIRPRRDADVDALIAKLGVSAPDDKTFVINLTTPATYFLSVAGPVDHRADPGEVDHQPERDRGRQLRRLRPVRPRHLEPQQPDRPQAEPELVRRRQADADRDRHVDDHRACPGPGGLRGG